jgi:hypothetical protein
VDKLVQQASEFLLRWRNCCCTLYNSFNAPIEQPDHFHISVSFAKCTKHIRFTPKTNLMKGSSSVCPHGSYYGQRGSYCSLGHHCSRANYCLPASHCATSASNTVRHDLGLLFYCSKPLLLLVSLLMYLPPSACGELHVLGLENIVCRCQHIICIFQLKILTAVLNRTTTQQVCN